MLLKKEFVWIKRLENNLRIQDFDLSAWYNGVPVPN
jgi:hypothetical protein